LCIKEGRKIENEEKEEEDGRKVFSSLTFLGERKST
jgi:hypothetical protein